MAVVRILSRIHTTLDKALNYIEKNEKQITDYTFQAMLVHLMCKEQLMIF